MEQSGIGLCPGTPSNLPEIKGSLMQFKKLKCESVGGTEMVSI